MSTSRLSSWRTQMCCWRPTQERDWAQWGRCRSEWVMGSKHSSYSCMWCLELAPIIWQGMALKNKAELVWLENAPHVPVQRERHRPNTGTLAEEIQHSFQWSDGNSKRLHSKICTKRWRNPKNLQSQICSILPETKGGSGNRSLAGSWRKWTEANGPHP